MKKISMGKQNKRGFSSLELSPSIKTVKDLYGELISLQ